MTVPGMAKYGKIAADLVRRIDSGEFEPGDRLPSQQSMAKQYGVTVMTLRQALGELVSDGFLYASQGRGTFVSERAVPYRLGPLSGFSSEMRAQGLDVRTKVLSLKTGVDDQTIRSRLGLEAGQGITRLERLRTLRGKPVIYQETFMSDEYGRKLFKHELEDASLYDLLQLKFGIPIVRAEETLRAVELGDEAGILKRNRGSAAFLSIRATIGQSDRCVLLDRTLLPGDSTEVKADRLADRHHVLFLIDSARSA